MTARKLHRAHPNTLYWSTVLMSVPFTVYSQEKCTRLGSGGMPRKERENRMESMKKNLLFE